MASKVRLYADHPLGQGQTVPLSPEQAHYLFGVMRLEAGAVLSLFNGRDGEWDAEVTAARKKGGELTARARTRPLVLPPDLWLLFAPIKKARTDFIVEKAVEMGAARILPVLTEFTNAERVRVDRLQAHAIEAAEQCGGTFVPEVAEPEKLGRLLDRWPGDRVLYFCDETLVSDAHSQTGIVPEPGPPPPSALLIGPEGGFSQSERARLAALPYTRPMRLGPRILRADTAAVAAMTLWQATAGDWR